MMENCLNLCISINSAQEMEGHTRDMELVTGHFFNAESTWQMYVYLVCIVHIMCLDIYIRKNSCVQGIFEAYWDAVK